MTRTENLLTCPQCDTVILARVSAHNDWQWLCNQVLLFSIDQSFNNVFSAFGGMTREAVYQCLVLEC